MLLIRGFLTASWTRDGETQARWQVPEISGRVHSAPLVSCDSGANIGLPGQILSPGQFNVHVLVIN